MSKTEEISLSTMQRDTESTSKAHRSTPKAPGHRHGFLENGPGHRGFNLLRFGHIRSSLRGVLGAISSGVRMTGLPSSLLLGAARPDQIDDIGKAPRQCPIEGDQSSAVVAGQGGEVGVGHLAVPRTVARTAARSQSA